MRRSGAIPTITAFSSSTSSRACANPPAAVVFLPPLGKVFHTVPFSLKEVVAVGAVASLVLWVEKLRKLIVRCRERRNRPESPENDSE